MEIGEKMTPDGVQEETITDGYAEIEKKTKKQIADYWYAKYL